MTPTALAPQRPVALLLHGLCSTPDELLSVHSALKHAGYPCLPVHIPGYSFEPERQRQLQQPHQQWLASVQQHVLALQAQGQRVVLIGISAGATLALASALAYPGAHAGLVLLSTPLRLDGWAIPAYQFLLPLALYTPLGRWWRYRESPPYGVKNERLRAWIASELAQRRVSSAGAAVIEVGHLREHHRLQRYVRRHLAHLQAPLTLAMHAREDEIASLRNLDLLVRHVPPAVLHTLVLENSYHMISMDNDRHAVCRKVLDFMALVQQQVEDAAAANNR